MRAVRLRSLLPLLVAVAVMLPLGACKQQANAPVRSEPMSLSEVQSGLRTLGYYFGPVDGISGPQTLNAIQAFESANGLPVTGTPSPIVQRTIQLRLYDKGLVTTALPGAAAAAPATPPRTQTAARGRGAPLSEARRIVAREFSPFDLAPVDLNGDGMTDAIASARWESGFCGAQACSHMVLMNTGTGFRDVAGDVLSIGLAPARTRTRGYLDLEGAAHGGRPFTMRWDGRRYRFSR